MGTHANSKTLAKIMQPQHLKLLQKIPFGSNFHRFRPICVPVASLSHSRLDISYFMNRASQFTEEKFGARHLKGLNTGIEHLKDTKKVGLSYELDMNSLQLRDYADRSFAINEEKS